MFVEKKGGEEKTFEEAIEEVKQKDLVIQNKITETNIYTKAILDKEEELKNVKKDITDLELELKGEKQLSEASRKGYLTKLENITKKQKKPVMIDVGTQTEGLSKENLGRKGDFAPLTIKEVKKE